MKRCVKCTQLVINEFVRIAFDVDMIIHARFLISLLCDVEFPRIRNTLNASLNLTCLSECKIFAIFYLFLCTMFVLVLTHWLRNLNIFQLNILLTNFMKSREMIWWKSLQSLKEMLTSKMHTWTVYASHFRRWNIFKYTNLCRTFCFPFVEKRTTKTSFSFIFAGCALFIPCLYMHVTF